ncbi:GNAT family N-acetyltransferase [Chitinilyticum aquatile]|uniref:GNAT family N-acetyltransferase n=1 Tax=Chitinilyticum aquatile TaxID=362520 RepID=UPI00040D8C37|nr:GNAT family N-acetyltransferase [Chitinilyticum aquatile]
MTYSSMQPRPARAEDFSAIVAWPQDAIELRNLFPRARWPADQQALAAHLAEHSDGLVLADHRDQPIAYASFYNVQQSGRVWIGHLIIHPAWRRQGLGARMLKEMEALARETFAATELATICFADNVGARVFYQRQGFRAEGWETRLDHREESVRVLRLVRPLPVAAPQPAGTAA